MGVAEEDRSTHGKKHLIRLQTHSPGKRTYEQRKKWRDPIFRTDQGNDFALLAKGKRLVGSTPGEKAKGKFRRLGTYDMANPQMENGFTPIAHEILEALARHRPAIGADEWRILAVLFRMTFGWQRKWTEISLENWALMTGMTKAHARRAIRKLLERNIISRSGNEGKPAYCFQKDFDSWRPLPEKAKRRPLPDQDTNISNSGNAALPNRDTSNVFKEKEINIKESTVACLGNEAEELESLQLREQNLERLKALGRQLEPVRYQNS